MSEIRFILQSEKSFMPIRTVVDEINCSECGGHFYVDCKAIPDVCPFCEGTLNLKDGIRNDWRKN